MDQLGLPSTTTYPVLSGWVSSISLVNPKTSEYQGVLRSTSVTVTPTWLIAAMSGMSAPVRSGGGDGDVKSVGGGNADQSGKIGVVGEISASTWVKKADSLPDPTFV
jgi:hypothetical protein